MKNVSFRNDVLPLKNLLFRLAFRITLSKEEAEDVVQDTLIKVWDKRYEWETIDSIEAYAMKICRNLSLDRIKKKDNQNASFEERQFATELYTTTTPHEVMIQQDRIRWVGEIINNLPEKQRSCIQLREFEGKPYKEIAEALGISEEQVKVNIFRARQAIKSRFNELDNYGL